MHSLQDIGNPSHWCSAPKHGPCSIVVWPREHSCGSAARELGRPLSGVIFQKSVYAVLSPIILFACTSQVLDNLWYSKNPIRTSYRRCSNCVTVLEFGLWKAVQNERATGQDFSSFHLNGIYLAMSLMETRSARSLCCLWNEVINAWIDMGTRFCKS